MLGFFQLSNTLEECLFSPTFPTIPRSKLVGEGRGTGKEKQNKADTEGRGEGDRKKRKGGTERRREKRKRRANSESLSPRA